MSEPAGRVCEDPARHCRKEGTPEGGAAAGYVFLPSSLSYNKEEGRPPGRDPANVTQNTGNPSRKASPVCGRMETCEKRFPRQVRLSKPGGPGRNSDYTLNANIAKQNPAWLAPCRVGAGSISGRASFRGVSPVAQSPLSASLALPRASSPGVAGRTAVTVQMKMSAWPASGWLPSRVTLSSLISVTR